MNPSFCHPSTLHTLPSLAPRYIESLEFQASLFPLCTLNEFKEPKMNQLRQEFLNPGLTLIFSPSLNIFCIVEQTKRNFPFSSGYSPEPAHQGLLTFTNRSVSLWIQEMPPFSFKGLGETPQARSF